MNWFVELPADVTLQISALVAVAVGFLLAKLIALLPWLSFLEQWRDPLSKAIALELIVLLQNALPSQYPEISILAVKLVLEVLVILAAFSVLKKNGYRLFQ
jgi:hypothetical protein